MARRLLGTTRANISGMMAAQTSTKHHRRRKSRAVKLHTKTTLLISVITVAVMLATILLMSVRMANLVRENEENLAQLQALSLAEQISLMPLPRDNDDLVRAVAQARGARPSITAVRVWELTPDQLLERTTSPEDLRGQPLKADAQQVLKEALAAPLARPLPAQTNVSEGLLLYQVFAPIQERGRPAGVVEVVERLNNVPSIVRQYAWNAASLTLIAVGLVTLATYFSYRYFVYSPLERLLHTISRTGTQQHANVKQTTLDDEFGRASKEYDRMLAQVHALTEERDRQQEILRERVREATRELQQRNEQLADANRELWETSRRLSQMERLAVAGQTAAQFAHEVGTPLNTISIHVEMLRDRVGNDADALRRTGIVSEQLERIERIVRSMLDRTRIEKPVLQVLDAGLLLDHICETMSPALRARKVELHKSFAAALPRIAADPDRMQQVFINLINNALDAMPDGGELRLCAAAEGSELCIEVSDTGCGMDEETRRRIFDPLYTTKQRGRGTGFGLVVVKQILDEHQGTIAVTSTPGQGSSFHLHFPALMAELLPATSANHS